MDIFSARSAPGSGREHRRSRARTKAADAAIGEGVVNDAAPFSAALERAGSA